MSTCHVPAVILVRPREEATSWLVSDRFRKLMTDLASRFSAVRFVSIPFLYDATEDTETLRTLQAIETPILLLSTLSERAAQGLLDAMDSSGSNVTCSQVEVFSVGALEPVIAEFSRQADFNGASQFEPLFIQETLPPRWYPIIDHNACCRCLECVNFCLFGVYTIGEGDRPIVESPQACRDGCPACSRVCPAGAIMFPLYPDEAISGKLNAQTVREQVRNPETIHQVETIRDHYLNQGQHNTTASNELDELVDKTDSF